MKKFLCWALFTGGISHPDLFSDNYVIVTMLMIVITDLFKFQAYVAECKFSTNYLTNQIKSNLNQRGENWSTQRKIPQGRRREPTNSTQIW